MAATSTATPIPTLTAHNSHHQHPFLSSCNSPNLFFLDNSLLFWDAQVTWKMLKIIGIWSNEWKRFSLRDSKDYLSIWSLQCVECEWVRVSVQWVFLQCVRSSICLRSMEGVCGPLSECSEARLPPTMWAAIVMLAQIRQQVTAGGRSLHSCLTSLSV